jgi:mannose-6-phosphate isomerase
MQPSAPRSDLRLEILGTAFSITADEEAAYLEKLLLDYYHKIEDVQKSTGLKDPLKIAILTGYVLCDELHKIRQNISATAPEEEESLKRTLNLIARLDEALEGNAQTPSQAVYPLSNRVKHYEWGSPSWIPELMDIENPENEPWAELWMGVHPASPSMVSVQGKETSLEDLITAHPSHFLGKEAVQNFDTLPFLFKLLAASQPLSIQAHPSKEQAMQGWQRENERGIPLDAPERNYKDDNHKPEILCALSPFTAMCGFRDPGDISALLSAYFANAPLALQSGLAPLWAALSLAPSGSGAGTALRAFLKTLFSIPPDVREELTRFIRSTPVPAPASGDMDPWTVVRRFAELYPGDPGILAPLYLNLLRLAPGEAFYLPSGILHAYVDGFGVELMANSDNVLRGGLTPKHVDVDELMKTLDFRPFAPELLAAPDTSSCFTYASPCREFSLSVLRDFQGQFPIHTAAIVMVTQGSLRISAGETGGAQAPEGTQTSWELLPGESAFIPPSVNPLTLTGTYTLYAASIPIT